MNVVILTVVSFVLGAGLVWLVCAVQNRSARETARLVTDRQTKACQRATAQAAEAETRATEAETRAKAAEAKAAELARNLKTAELATEDARGAGQRLEAQLATAEKDAKARAVGSRGELVSAQRAVDQAQEQAAAVIQELAQQRQTVARATEQLTQTQAQLEAAQQQVASLETSLAAAPQQGAEAPAAPAGGGTTVLEVLDTDPTLHAAARETIRMLYERFTKSKK